MYLIPSDFELQVRKEIKSILQGTSEIKLKKAEMAAVGQMKNYLKSRYDLEKIFPVILPFQETKNYQPGELVFYTLPEALLESGLIYECLEESTGNLPTDQVYFKQHDPRDAFVYLYLVDLVLYHLHSSFSQQVIPELRYDRYKEALDWLIGVSNGEIEAHLPAKPVEDQAATSFIRFGSHPKENHRY